MICHFDERVTSCLFCLCFFECICRQPFKAASHVGFRNQVRIVHLGGFFSPATGFPSACFGLIFAICKLIPCRASSANRFQACWEIRYPCHGSTREYNRCKLCHRLDVQDPSSSIDINSHVGSHVHCMLLMAYRALKLVCVRWNVAEIPSKGALKLGHTGFLDKVRDLSAIFPLLCFAHTFSPDCIH
jgi:hypothetical protein